MRMRRKPWARPELESCHFFIQKPSEYRGRWKEFFKNDNPIYLELGCGKGTFMAVHGAENPNINYIAIDIKDEVLVLAKRNIEKAYEEKKHELNNVALMSQEIALIDDMLSKEDTVDRIYINFCNPWPKDRHKKRRLTHTRQLEKYKTFLRKEGEIWFKTDDDELFEESLGYFKDCNLEIKYVTYDLHNSGFEGNVVTEHEEMFTKQGIKTKFLIAEYK
ncbi:tRNA (guanosine(46)-N7)-methyltransferase TrmB [Clostridium sp. NSJ-6]|uniref:tRNA (guanine-N(7)-)-methyltransferase n=1 Tax=Clostridium hominis TaxID=2763036 RepID=A0ABR7DI74_9CLOT|nr:tRNA (guanosine(46)-N7)-methyltransferase TrmB [Clostridium hominis]MBC5631150.1 tRNA (guanosine(46)-N7)-methyltransferase TrmB [Clostridium hominis]MDU2671231.1 tRNA (guanosine(46)-N7)-methyltransferase TrmB [Clostridium sp.]